MPAFSHPRADASHMIAMTNLRAMHEPKRFAVAPSRAYRRRRRKLALDLIIDLLRDIAGRFIRGQHGLIMMDLFRAGGATWQIREFGGCRGRARWRS